jgi:hypothetical protein
MLVEVGFESQIKIFRSTGFGFDEEDLSQDFLS